MAASLFALGAAVIRFNFRGVGASVGTFDRGIGELEDARAALAWMAARHPQARRWAAGFSFGSWVASRLAASDPGIEQLILIAPPVHTQTFEEMTTCATPKWVVQGTADDICRPENLERVIGTWAPPCTRIHIEGASHFFDKQLADLSRVLHEHLSPAVPAPPQPSA